MGIQLFTDNASEVPLASPLTAAATSMQLTAGGGAFFPVIAGGSGDWFIATLQRIVAGVVTAQEIIKVTATTSDTFGTIVRAQEGTAALAWNAGDTLSLLITAGGLGQMIQAALAQAQGYNYAADTGAADAYVAVFTPAISAHAIGMPLRILVAHSNTGPSTFNEGAGAVAIVTANGAALTGGELKAGSIVELIWNGAAFVLSAGAFTTTGQVSAIVAAAITAIVAAASLGTDGFIELVFGGTTFILNFGVAVGAHTGSTPGPVSVTYAMSFPTACLGQMVTSKRGVVGSIPASFSQNNANTGGTTLDVSGNVCVVDCDTDGYQRGFYWAWGN